MWGQAGATGLVHLLYEDVGSGECTLPSLDSHCDISCQFCPCLGSLWSVLCSGRKFLIFYYKSEFNSSWVVFPNNCSVSFWYCIVQCTHWSRTYSPTPAPYLQPWPACSCSLPVIVPNVFPGISGNRKVLSCICVKFLCIFGVHRSTLTSQWLHSVPSSFWCHSVSYTHCNKRWV